MYTILKNSNLSLEAGADYQDNGWSFSNGVAVHDKCNEGYFENIIFSPGADKEYSLSFTVAGLTDGTVRVYLGGYEFDEITENGNYTLVGITEDNGRLTFWSDANVVISNISISEGIKPAETILFDFDNRQFSGNASYTGEFATLFLDNMLSFKNGTLWIHDKNETRNSYYGVKYPSVVTFYVNVNSSVDKDFYSIALNGNMPVRVDIEIEPKEGKSIGQKSRIKKGNFKLQKGQYIADFLRDMNDPRFQDENVALFQGAELQGKIMKVTLTNDNDGDFRLASVEVDVSVK